MRWEKRWLKVQTVNQKLLFLQGAPRKSKSIQSIDPILIIIVETGENGKILAKKLHHIRNIYEANLTST